MSSYPPHFQDHQLPPPSQLFYRQPPSTQLPHHQPPPNQPAHHQQQQHSSPPTLPQPYQMPHHPQHRRSSSLAHHPVHAAAPYAIPHKVGANNNSKSASPMPPMQSEYSQSYPLLSRDFVVRRISEGETGRLKEELKCEACGKGYKHISSLAKHLWEHTPEWNVTKKLLISKHQQVQLLELASILCSMTEPPLTPRTSPSRYQSDSPVEYDNAVDPSSTSNASDSPSSFEGNTHSHLNHSTATTNTTTTTTEIKFRHNSISQYPPQGLSPPQNINSSTQASTSGGYLDIVDRNNTERRRNGSVTSTGSHRDEDGLLAQAKLDPESVKSEPHDSFHHKNSVSTINSDRTLKNGAEDQR